MCSMTKRACRNIARHMQCTTDMHRYAAQHKCGRRACRHLFHDATSSRKRSHTTFRYVCSVSCVHVVLEQSINYVIYMHACINCAVLFEMLLLLVLGGMTVAAAPAAPSTSTSNQQSPLPACLEWSVYMPHIYLYMYKQCAADERVSRK